jgi:hypothetical protein
MVVAARLFAKADTIKVTIKGADLNTPVEITDPKVLTSFRVWTGPGTSSNEAKAFIIDWSQGPAAERPKGLQRQEVHFALGGAAPSALRGLFPPVLRALFVSVRERSEADVIRRFVA